MNFSKVIFIMSIFTMLNITKGRNLVWNRNRTNAFNNLKFNK